MPTTLTARFKLERETKGAVLYKEVDSNDNPITIITGSFYLRKTAVGGPPFPTYLTIDITTIQ